MGKGGGGHKECCRVVGAFKIKRLLIMRIYRCHLFEDKLMSPS